MLRNPTSTSFVAGLPSLRYLGLPRSDASNEEGGGKEGTRLPIGIAKQTTQKVGLRERSSLVYERSEFDPTGCELMRIPKGVNYGTPGLLGGKKRVLLLLASSLAT